jgi:hypothetical protein
MCLRLSHTLPIVVAIRLHETVKQKSLTVVVDAAVNDGDSGVGLEQLASLGRLGEGLTWAQRYAGHLAGQRTHRTLKT